MKVTIELEREEYEVSRGYLWAVMAREIDEWLALHKNGMLNSLKLIYLKVE